VDEDLMNLILEAFRGTGLESGGWAMQLLGAILPGSGTSAARSTPAQSGQQSAAASVGHAALRVLTSGFGLAPVVRGIMGLFGGGDPAPPPPLIRYALPPRLQISAANTRGTAPIELVDYSQEGAPRVVRSDTEVRTARVASPPGEAETFGQGDSFGAETAGNASEEVPMPANTLDSRWIMDHSYDIARAVREAMLNMHSLNDVVADL
jgi:hypothetical protein